MFPTSSAWFGAVFRTSCVGTCSLEPTFAQTCAPKHVSHDLMGFSVVDVCQGGGYTSQDLR